MAFQMALVRDGSLDGSWELAKHPAAPALEASKSAEPCLSEDDLPTEFGEDLAPLTAQETFTWYSSDDNDAPEDEFESRAAAIARRASGKALPSAGSPGHAPSVWSLRHALGECRPCAWFHKSAGCHFGSDCEHCHVCGPDEHKRRKAVKVEARRKEKQAQQAQQSQLAPEPQPLCLPPPSPSLSAQAAAPGETESRRSPSSVSLGSAMWSIGSAGHDAGECQPCAWFWKPQGCLGGAECLRCHICPNGEVVNRKRAKHTQRRAGRGGAASPSEAAAPEERRVTAGEPEAPTTTSNLSVEVVSPRAPPGLPAPEEQRATAGEPEAPTATDTLSAALASPGLSATPGPEAPPGLRQPGASEGSAGHWRGECEPCAWFWRPGGCTHGEACGRCHLCPDGAIKAIKRAKKDLRRRASGADEPGQPAAALDKDQPAPEGPLGAEERPAAEEPPAARVAAAPEERLAAAGEPEAPMETGTLFVEVLAPRAPPGLPSPPALISSGSSGLGLAARPLPQGFRPPPGLPSAAEPFRPPRGFQPPPGMAAPRRGFPEAL